jgi:hypothetical protein
MRASKRHLTLCARRQPGCISSVFPPEHPPPELPAAHEQQPVADSHPRGGIVYAQPSSAWEQAVTWAITKAMTAMAGSSHIFRT